MISWRYLVNTPLPGSRAPRSGTAEFPGPTFADSPHGRDHPSPYLGIGPPGFCSFAGFGPPRRITGRGSDFLASHRIGPLGFRSLAAAWVLGQRSTPGKTG